MQKIILKYGLYSGALAALLMLATGLMIKSQGVASAEAWHGYAGMILSMLFVFVGVRHYRDHERNGSITFGEAFKVGGLIALISCLCYVAAWMLVYHFVLPDFMEQFIQFYLEKMKTNGTADAEIQEAAAEMEHYRVMYQNPLYRAALTIIEPLPVALLMSLVSAFLNKRA